jgi:serine protease Do
MEEDMAIQGISPGTFSALSEEAAEIADRVRGGVVTVRSGRGGHGSGVVWSEDGMIVTNNHVVASGRVEVALADGRTLPASVVRTDRRGDLALLRVEAASLPAIPVGDSHGLRPGQLVLAVGNPLGVRGAVSLGIISGTVGGVWVGGRRLSEMVRADIDLYPGNSGGPLLDAWGRVIGINTMVTGPGAALAVPSHMVRRMVAGQVPPRPYIGITGRQVPLLAASGMPLPARLGSGLLVQGVLAGGPAERAGVLAGDLLIGLEGVTQGVGKSISEQIEGLSPDAICHLSLLRDGRLLKVDVRPEWRN